MEMTEEMQDDKKGRAKKIRSRIKADGGEKRERRVQIAKKVRAMLTKTNPDDSEKIAETPFTVAGVERLMKTLNERAQKAESRGGKVAQNMLKFLSADEKDEEQVAGASVKKLKIIAERTSSMQEKRKQRRS